MAAIVLRRVKVLAEPADVLSPKLRTLMRELREELAAQQKFLDSFII